MSLPLTWGLVMIGTGVSCVLYGISCAQVFFYFQTYRKRDLLRFRLLTALVWALNTLHLGFAIHIPWYYLVDGAGGKHDDVVVWSWPASIIVTVLITLPVYAFFIRRIYVLGGGKWLCALVALLACTHFTIGLAFCISALLDNRIAAVSAPRSNGLVSVALVFGTVTDVGIAALMCWRLLASRTGWGRTDTVLRTLITYTINSGVLTALCVLGGLAASVAAKGTQFELFFLLILPELYVNSYLGSLNAREVLLSQGDHSDDKWSVSGCGRALAMSVRGAGGADSGAHGGRPPVIRVERSTVRHTDSGLPDGKDELDGARGASLPDFDLERAETKEDHSLSYAGQ